VVWELVSVASFNAAAAALSVAAAAEEADGCLAGAAAAGRLVWDGFACVARAGTDGAEAGTAAAAEIAEVDIMGAF
jgi:hypothetical protein